MCSTTRDRRSNKNVFLFPVDGEKLTREREIICGAGCHVDVVLHTEPTDVDAKPSTRSTITKRLQFNTCITCILSNMYRRVNVRRMRKAQTHVYLFKVSVSLLLPLLWPERRLRVIFQTKIKYKKQRRKQFSFLLCLSLSFSLSFSLALQRSLYNPHIHSNGQQQQQLSM